MRIVSVSTNKKTRKIIKDLDLICFPEDEPCSVMGRKWWIVYEDGKPIGYAGIRRIGDYGFLCRVGVLPEYRGQGLQKKLLKKRIDWAKQQGLSQIITYTVTTNPKSSNSLIKKGFKLYEPEDPYAGEDVLYWYKFI